ncbi:hypothetical protein GWK16_10940 [Roseomonas sp. JC162]|uniref:DUF1508 domain-containing protein n=1 Tax=Neoroseomonas marina TaxID=1232220 RepID=A0A848EE93_9PROT|nr:hypothetical protein [Neoroseomonas marina]NMJ41760.1 hypothetical protein [Neoroseomonas marina]
MIEVVEDPQTGHFRLVTRDGETLAITTTRAAAGDLVDLLMEAWEDALAAAVARARMKHGAAIIEPR